jgi:putative hydrolase of the HAD superfamily
MTQSAHPAIVFTDADNTLWDTNAVFAAAQLRLLDRTEAAIGIKSAEPDRLAIVREVDQLLAKFHHADLKYPPRLLVAALAMTLSGRKPTRAARDVLSGSASTMIAALDAGDIEHLFIVDLQQTPELRCGVSEGLSALSAAALEVIVITEGSKAKCEKLLAHYQLAHHVTRLLEGAKRPELYKRALAWSGSHPIAFMIGDQLDRDVGPAKEAGLSTIYFPGDFRPYWTPEIAKIRPDVTVTDYNEAANWIITEAERRIR